jgi:hypothetical protein
MNYKDVKILLPTCNQYIHLTQGLIYTLNKFWPNHGEIIIIGYDKPKFSLDDKCTFISMGEQLGPHEWSNDLIKFFEDFGDEYFINIIDDTLMTRDADENQIEYLFNMIKNDNDIGKIFIHGSLAGSGNFSILDDEKYDLISINQTCDYRTSIQSSIWRKSYFLQLLKPNLTPWQFELQHIKNDGVKIISTRSNHPTMYSHLYRIGNKFMKECWYKSVFEPTELGQEDKEKIITMLNLPV